MLNDNTNSSQISSYFVYEVAEDSKPKIKLLNATLDEVARVTNVATVTIIAHLQGNYEINGFIIVEAKDLTEANKLAKRKLNKGNVFVFKIENKELTLVVPFSNVQDATKIIDNYSANVYAYLKGKVNTLGGYVLVEASSLEEAHKKAKCRYMRSRLYLMSNDIKALSDEQVAKITQVLDEAGVEGGTAIQTKTKKNEKYVANR